MSLRLAFIGFRHGHILSLYQHALAHPDVTIVAACESDPDTRAGLAKAGLVTLTHDDPTRLLDDVDCDAIAVGDVYGRRGAHLIAALERGRHIIGDKPLCTHLAELERIAELATAGRRCVSCQLDLRDTGNFRALRELTQSGALGAIHAVAITGQHPLLLGKRPAWYFEPGSHGGTLNDIAIHAVDLLPWLTGHAVTRINAARGWNALAPATPHFQDGAQFMLSLANGCGVIGDMSYFTPDSHGYKNPQYWRTTLWGEHGLAEVGTGTPGVRFWRNGAADVVDIPPAEPRPGGYLDAFVREIAGESPGTLSLTTAETLASARVALRLQHAADTGATNVDLAQA